MLMIMIEIEKTQFFDGKKIRTVWDDEKQEWFFSIKSQQFQRALVLRRQGRCVNF